MFIQVDMDFEWMDEHRKANIKAHKNDIKKSLSSKRVAYADPDEGGAFGSLPAGDVLITVKIRSQTRGATKSAILWEILQS